MRLFGVSFIYRARFTGSNRPVDNVMESIRIVRADSLTAARQQARSLGKKFEHAYANMDGDEIKWCFEAFKIFEVLETNEILETEIFSRFLDDKIGLLLLATGYEK